MKIFGRDIYNILKIVLGIIIGFLLTFSIRASLSQNLSVDNVIEVGVSFLTATISLMLITLTVGEGIRNREEMRKQSEKERRRLRLKEKLEGLYSPLMAEIDSFRIDESENYDFYTYNVLDNVMEKHTIKAKYQYLASEELRRNLQRYFDRSKTTSLIHDKGNWIGLLQQITYTIKKDFNDITQEYNEITSE